MYAIFLQGTHCVKKTLIVLCTLLCESGDRVMVDQSSFSADLHAVMLRHHCSEYGGGYSKSVGYKCTLHWFPYIYLLSSPHLSNIYKIIFKTLAIITILRPF